VRRVVSTYRDDRPLADDMSIAFRMIADEAPPPLPNPGNIGPRPVTSGRGPELAVLVKVANVASVPDTGKLDASAHGAANDATTAPIMNAPNHGPTVAREA